MNTPITPTPTPDSAGTLVGFAHSCAQLVETWRREDDELADALSGLGPEDRDSISEERTRRRIEAARARAVLDKVRHHGLSLTQ